MKSVSYETSFTDRIFADTTSYEGGSGCRLVVSLIVDNADRIAKAFDSCHVPRISTIQHPGTNPDASGRHRILEYEQYKNMTLSMKQSILTDCFAVAVPPCQVPIPPASDSVLPAKPIDTGFVVAVSVTSAGLLGLIFAKIRSGRFPRDLLQDMLSHVLSEVCCTKSCVLKK